MRDRSPGKHCRRPGGLEVEAAGDAVNVQDLLHVVVDWGSCPSPPAFCLGDVNSDNEVNVLDLLDVVLNWGDCP